MTLVLDYVPGLAGSDPEYGRESWDYMTEELADLDGPEPEPASAWPPRPPRPPLTALGYADWDDDDECQPGSTR